MRKWLNISDKDSNYSADPEDDDDNYTDSDNEGLLSNLKYFLFSCSKFCSLSCFFSSIYFSLNWVFMDLVLSFLGCPFKIL